MLLFIPMAGTGDRYMRAGYTKPKPLIDVDGKPMIERVLDCYPRDLPCLFGVNRLHAETTELLAVLRRLRPAAKVVIMDPHKDGPVRSMMECAQDIPDDVPVCLNYCDFGVQWSFDAFHKWLDAGQWDAAMSAYRGFHPHSLGPTLYAYMRNDADRVLEIREKHHFTTNKFEEYASAGLYWFRSGALLKSASRQLMATGARVNNEFYVSMVVQEVIENGGRVGVHELDRFFQWGTPEDLRDYEGWAHGMRALDGFLGQLARARSRSATVIPMAGRGKRFADQGYALPKPLVEVAGAPMIQRVLEFLPSTTEPCVLVAQREHMSDGRVEKTARARFPTTRVVPLDYVTEGQACTARLGVEGLASETPVLFAPCDAGYLYDPSVWSSLEASADADLVVWAARNHLPALWRPHMYGWLSGDNGWAHVVKVKESVPDVPLRDQFVITGTFWFPSVRGFLGAYEDLLAANERVNGEFYLDTIAKRMVEAGKRVRIFEVEKFMPWGTPEELKTFLYWNDVFREGRHLA